jgi:hypothetical protein
MQTPLEMMILLKSWIKKNLMSTKRKKKTRIKKKSKLKTLTKAKSKSNPSMSSKLKAQEVLRSSA